MRPTAGRGPGIAEFAAGLRDAAIVRRLERASAAWRATKLPAWCSFVSLHRSPLLHLALACALPQDIRFVAYGVCYSARGLVREARDGERPPAVVRQLNEGLPALARLRREPSPKRGHELGVIGRVRRDGLPSGLVERLAVVERDDRGTVEALASVLDLDDELAGLS